VTKRDLAKLRRALPKGYRLLIANDLGYSVSYINKVLRGDKTNDDIILHAISLAKKEREKKSVILNEVRAL